MNPIIRKHRAVSPNDIPKDSEDGKIFYSALDNVAKLESEVKAIISAKGNMLRHYAEIVRKSNQKAYAEIKVTSKNVRIEI